MGLDMGLYKTSKIHLKFRCGKIVSDSELWENCEEVGYWRKANAIHRWFIDKVQSGLDDCGYYIVSEDDLKELLATCKEVMNSLELITDEETKIKVIKDTSTAKELLPTLAGFFFGSTDYDENYYDDINDTIKIVEKVLKETRFGNEVILYSSSW